jgi:hypothetical protein
MTMDPIFSQPGRIAPAIPAPAFPVASVPVLTQRDRIDRLADLTPEDKTAGLVWLAMHAPVTCDAMLDALESDAWDDAADASEEPEPYCLLCGADVGIFLRFGLDWRHYWGDGSTVGRIELFDPGHAPVVAWSLPGTTAAR